MGVVRAISKNSFRRALRSRIFAVLLLFAIGLILLAKLFEFLTFAAEVKIIKDVGLASIAFFTALIGIFLGGGAISGEVEAKTTYQVFSKPVSRGKFILGNFVGLIFALLCVMAITISAFLILLFLKKTTLGIVEVEALLFIFFEAVVVSSIALMFSSLASSTTTSTIFSFFLFLVGHFNPQLRFLGEKLKSPLGEWIIKVLTWLLPNLEYFNLREEVAKGGVVSLSRIGWVGGYALIYTLSMLILAYLLLRRKEF